MHLYCVIVRYQEKKDCRTHHMRNNHAIVTEGVHIACSISIPEAEYYNVQAPAKSLDSIMPCMLLKIVENRNVATPCFLPYKTIAMTEVGLQAAGLLS